MRRVRLCKVAVAPERRSAALPPDSKTNYAVAAGLRVGHIWWAMLVAEK